jgi:uncharacterized membrane protein
MVPGRLARHLLTTERGSRLNRKAHIMRTTPRNGMTDERSPAGPALNQLERWGALTAAAAVVAIGSRQRNLPRFAVAAAAAPLAFRGLAGRWPVSRHEDTRDALSGPRGAHVLESVRIERPVEDVYRFWRRLENLPQFMDYLVAVTDRGDGRSHWVARGPGGITVQWEAEIINEVENKVIGWRSLTNADVVSAGSVNFYPMRDGRATQVTVKMQYAPPAGRFGAAVAKALWRSPEQTVREDLRRLKQLLEAGERATAGSDRVRGGAA